MWVLGVLAIVLVIAALAARRGKPVRMSGEEVATEIENFISGAADLRDWDDFISVPIADPYLNRLREQCAVTDDAFPPSANSDWCSDEGVVVLRQLAAEARAHQADNGNGGSGVPPNSPGWRGWIGALLVTCSAPLLVYGALMPVNKYEPFFPEMHGFDCDGPIGVWIVIIPGIFLALSGLALSVSAFRRTQSMLPRFAAPLAVLLLLAATAKVPSVVAEQRYNGQSSSPWN